MFTSFWEDYFLDSANEISVMTWVPCPFQRQTLHTTPLLLPRQLDLLPPPACVLSFHPSSEEMAVASLSCSISLSLLPLSFPPFPSVTHSINYTQALSAWHTCLSLTCCSLPLTNSLRPLGTPMRPWVTGVTRCYPPETLGDPPWSLVVLMGQALPLQPCL